MNKYQEALNKLTPNDWDIVHHKDGWWSGQIQAVTLIQELVDKATPMRIIELDEDCSHFSCPSCKTEIYYADEYKHEHCLKCGQALDWSEDENK